jgi:hypothetical protein
MKKNNCIDCNKNTTNGIYILTGKDWIYEFYCINCSRAFLGKMCKKEMPSLLTLNKTALNMLSKEYDMLLEQSVKNMKKDNISLDKMPIKYKEYVLARSEDGM